jgi:hypothetical protein
MRRLLLLELAAGSVALLVSVATYLVTPSIIAFIAGVAAAVSWTSVTVHALVKLG